MIMLMEKIKEDLKSIVSIKSVHSKFLAYGSGCLMWGATAIATAGDVLLVAAGNVLLWLLNYIGAAVDVVAPSSRIWVQGERRAYPDETRAFQDTNYRAAFHQPGGGHYQLKKYINWSLLFSIHCISFKDIMVS